MTESLLQNFITQSSDADVCWFGEKKSVIQILWFLVLFCRREVKKYFWANVAVFKWTIAYCNKDNFEIQEKL